MKRNQMSATVSLLHILCYLVGDGKQKMNFNIFLKFSVFVQPVFSERACDMEWFW
jgi:hypothetical protein